MSLALGLNKSSSVAPDFSLTKFEYTLAEKNPNLQPILFSFRPSLAGHLEVPFAYPLPFE